MFGSGCLILQIELNRRCREEYCKFRRLHHCHAERLSFDFHSMILSMIGLFNKCLVVEIANKVV